MFSLRGFVMKGLLNAIGKLADYQVILNATGWYEKGVLLEEDLAEIQAKIDAKNTPVEQVEEEPIEEMPSEEEPQEEVDPNDN